MHITFFQSVHRIPLSTSSIYKKLDELVTLCFGRDPSPMIAPGDWLVGSKSLGTKAGLLEDTGTLIGPLLAGAHCWLDA